MPAKSPGRNATCPCGSGRKYKKCCGVAPTIARGHVPPPLTVPQRPELVGSHLQFLVTLDGLPVPVWRRLLLRRDATFADLHEAIQACGWDSTHLWWFHEPTINRGIAFAPGAKRGLPSDHNPPAHRVPLLAWFGALGASCQYEYDFGDGWLHTVVLEATAEHTDDFVVALLDGEGRFPPEDCGGVPGYCRLLEYAATGRDPWQEQGLLDDSLDRPSLDALTQIDLDRDRAFVGGPHLPAPSRDATS